jgi:hypothetical protein
MSLTRRPYRRGSLPYPRLALFPLKTKKDPNDFFNSTVSLLRHIGETDEWEITVTGQGEKPMSRFTFRGSRREADDMAIRGRLSAEVKLEATARNVKARPATEPARQG